MSPEAKKKIRVAVVYGGRSGEHEVSLRSGASVLKHLDRTRFEVVPVAIDKTGRWLMNDVTLLEKAGASLPVQAKGALPVSLPPYEQKDLPGLGRVDVVFPVIHGPLCEDGTIQGLFELADVAYVGSGVLGSAIGMDKDVAKRLADAAGIPVVPYVCVRAGEYKRDASFFHKTAESKLGYPMFVKPANMGSSVGVHKVKEAKALGPALADAFKYDTKVLIEKAIDAREIEVSVLESLDDAQPPQTSIAGEIVPSAEFYTYEAKYIDDDGAELLIPAKLDATQLKRAQEIARQAFSALELEGMARVDLFLDRKTGEFLLNEVNTIPGFTSISMYPKLWEASGIGYSDLLTRLVELAVRRHERKRNLLRER